MKRYFSAIVFLCLCLCAEAQFYLPGDNPGKVKWNHLYTDEFHLIYPAGLDSLAQCYARSLESFRVPVSNSVGYEPNGCYRRKMPVILHAFNASANGSVTWAPRRMDLYTVPDAYRPEPFPWIKELAIHESRHVAQMQFVNDHSYKVPGVLFGEMWGGAMSAVYGGPALLEGDAVTAETALSDYGRGRNADFLEYITVALDHGDWRDWYGWRYQSVKRFTPDYYKLGYMTVAGMRAVYDDPMFTSRFYSNIFRHKLWQLPFNVMNKTVRQASGKNLKESFREIQEEFIEDWREGFEERGPFMRIDTLSTAPRRYESFSGLTMASGRLFAIRDSYGRGRELVELVEDGKVRVLRPFAGQTGDLRWSEVLGLIVWSETVRDPRWELKQYSIIRTYSPQSGKCRNLTHEGRLFNPAPSPDGKQIAATDYPTSGGSEVVVLEAESGETLLSLRAPDSLQVVEAVWIGEEIYVSAISEGGFGIYRAGETFVEILGPRPVAVRQLREDESGRILFLSDRSGVNELYALNIRNGAIRQISNTKYGISDYLFSPGEERLYYTALSTDARYVCSTAGDELPRKDADWNNWHRYAIADRLSAQEREMQASAPEQQEQTVITTPSRYRKAGHLFHIHSWMPAFVDYDDVKNLSFENLTTAAKIGATLMFQNHLGSMSGSLGYAPNISEDGKLRNSGLLKMKYSGRYPVFEARLSVSEGTARQYQMYLIRSGQSASYANGFKTSGLPEVNASIKIYIPLSFSSGGWQRGIIPQISYSGSNNMFATSVRKMVSIPSLSGKDTRLFDGFTGGENVMLQRAQASVRAYITRPVAKSGVYPRWGIGIETGCSARPGLQELFSPNVFGYIYGYLPGITPRQGLRLTALAQRQIGNPRFGENYASVIPRGLGGASSAIAAIYPIQSRFTADYKMSIASVDWTGFCPVAYIRNFELTGHFDLGYYSGSRYPDVDKKGILFSTGAEFCTVLGNLLWIPYDTRVGVRYSYNSGSIFKDLKDLGADISNHTVELVFSIDF